MRLPTFDSVVERIDFPITFENRQGRSGKRHQFHETFVVSFSRSGRTWIKLMLFDCWFRSERKHHEFCGPCLFRHDGTLIHRSDSYVPNKRLRYRGNRIAFLARDPLDVVTSAFYFVKRVRRPVFHKASIGEFSRSEFGLPFIVRFFNDWAKYKSRVVEFRRFLYEDFIGDAAGSLLDLARFVGFLPERKFIRAAVKTFSFENMRLWDDWKSAYRYDDEEPDDREVRRGLRGDYRRSMDIETLSWCRRFLREKLSPYWNCYLEEVPT